MAMYKLAKDGIGTGDLKERKEIPLVFGIIEHFMANKNFNSLWVHRGQSSFDL